MGPFEAKITVEPERMNVDEDARIIECVCPPTDSDEIVIHEHDHTAEWGDQPIMKFFPDHFISEATTMLILLSLYSVLVIFHPAGLEIKADPNMTPKGIKPEWYFLFLYAFAHYVPPVVATMGPLLGIGFLIGLPWIDRNPSRKLVTRRVALALCGVTMLVLVALTVIGIRD